MFTVPVTSKMVKDAERKSAEMGALFGSILKGEGNFAGFIGEFAAADALNAEVHNTRDYDLLKDGYKIDVKTKQSNYVPKEDYEASVADFNTNQKCDYYLFARFSRRDGLVYILGLYQKDAFLDDARFVARGSYDSRNKFIARADMHNIEHHRLIGWECEDAEELREKWRNLTG